MKNDTDTVTSNNLQDEIDLRQLIEMLWDEKILIIDDLIATGGTAELGTP